MTGRRQIAIQIALQTHLLATCSEHGEIYCDDDIDPATTFALADEFENEASNGVETLAGESAALTDLVTDLLATTPTCCPICTSFRARTVGRGGYDSRRNHRVVYV